MPLGVNVLAALGCPGSAEELILIADWLRAEDVDCISQLRGCEHALRKRG